MKNYFLSLTLSLLFVGNGIAYAGEVAHITFNVCCPGGPGGAFDPSHGGNPNPRTPTPEATLLDYVITFATPLSGFALDVVQDGVIVWSDDYSDGTTTVILPSYLSGEYELQLIPEDCNYYFTGMISL
jgi:hypothetical protein